MSSRVLLDLEEADRIFKEKGLGEYLDYMAARGPYADDYDPAIGGRRLKKGPLWSFAEAALKLNEIAGEQIVEIGIVCKDEAGSALPIFRNLDVNGLARAEFRLALAGHKMHPSDLEAFDTDLFLTRNPKECQMAVDAGFAAATVNFPPDGKNYEDARPPVRIWVDGDSVAFGSSAEVRFKTNDIKSAIALEGQDFDKPLEPGPFTKVLAKMSELNARFPRGQEPFEISLLTSRGAEAAARVFNTAAELGIRFNGRLYFMGGMPKIGPLKAHKPDLYVDDQAVHLHEATAYCPTGLVAYAKDSAMYRYLRETAQQQGARDKFNGSANPRTENENSTTPPGWIPPPSPDASGPPPLHP